MKIAIVGIRGIPSSYSGFETIIGELGPRFVERGHQVTVYCRKSLFAQRPPLYKGVALRYLPSIEHKAFSTLSHSFLSMLHASASDVDIVFAVNAANGFYGFIPRLLGKKCVLNVNGMEWLRPKWNRFARWVFRTSARLGTKLYDEIVTDAEEMHRLYAREFGIDSTYIAYGANIETSSDPAVVKKYGLKPFEYYLIASRLVPDNNADLIIQGFARTRSGKKLAIAGGADYAGNHIEREFVDRLRALADERVIFLGHVADQKHVKELHCNCFAYIHGHQFGGINPALLKALGCSNCVIALNTPFNSEVLDRGKYGILFEKDAASLAEKIESIEVDRELWFSFRSRSVLRIKERFSWDSVADEYLDLFSRVVTNSRVRRIK